MITIDDVVRETRIVAAEKSDYVYPNKICTYIGCQCIFGVVLSNLFPDKDLRKYEQQSIHNIIYDIFGKIQNVKKVSWCICVQANQDSAMPWGECVANADKEYPNLKENNNVS
mgnify:CR=1 FL=1